MPDMDAPLPLPATPDLARDTARLEAEIGQLLPILDRADASPQLSQLLRIIARGKAMGADGSAMLEKFAGRLKELRAFDDLYVLTAAMNADGMASDLTRRLEVQALIELGAFELALDLVRPLLAGDVAAPGKAGHSCREAYGLLGRIYKQMFINESRTDRRTEREALQLYIKRSFDAYMHVWNRLKTTDTTYQAINALAVAQRGVADGFFKDGDIVSTGALAREIIATISSATEPNPWAEATRGEALVALGDYEGAARAYANHANDPGVNPFALASSLRQLEEVWRLEGGDPIKGKPVRTLKLALLGKLGGMGAVNKATSAAPGSLESLQIRMSAAELRLAPADLDSLPEEAALPLPAGVDGADAKALQKAYGFNQPLCRRAIRRKMLLSSAVCRIQGPDQGRIRGIGTGFAIKGELLHESWAGKTLIVTNNHVISSSGAATSKHPSLCNAVFVGDDDNDNAPVSFSRVLWESDSGAYDITVLEPAGDLPPSVRPLADLARAPLGPQAQNDDGIGRCYVIGFYNASELSFSLADNILLDHNAPATCEIAEVDGKRVCRNLPSHPVLIHYRTPTERGHSGSPVFDDTDIALLGVHHSGHKEMKRLNNRPGVYAANEGIWIDSIRDAIATSLAAGHEATADKPGLWGAPAAAPAAPPAPVDPGELVFPTAAKPSGLTAFAGDIRPGISSLAPELIYPPGPATEDDWRAAQLETVIGVDNRTRIHDTQMSPWRMICAIRARWGSNLMVGTGCFIGPDAILTAGHVVHAGEFRSNAPHVEVIPGLSHERVNGETRPYGSALATQIHVHPSWTSNFLPNFDVAVIRLDKRLGDQVGWFGVEAREKAALLRNWAHVSGYPGEMKEQRPKAGAPQQAPAIAAQLWHHAAPIERADLGRLFYKTDTTPGQSGAPIYVLPAAGQFNLPVAVGVHAYGVRSTPGVIGLANSGVWIDAAMLQQIREWSGR